MKNTLTINGNEVRITDERNLLELIRKAGIELPTFCYHSELSIYGGCRLCLVEIEGRGVVASCSIKPEAGMKIKTHTEELRSLRKINLELILAAHDQACATCHKGDSCALLSLSQKLGVDKVRFKPQKKKFEIDNSNPSIVRDTSKCILCGDCVRMCHEVQGIGAIDFAFRGSSATVAPPFGKKLGEVECVMCGQCARVCPTGAITVKSDIEFLWKALSDSNNYVIAQIAPAVRVALGEIFGFAPGEDVSGKIVSALRKIGFAAVYDTSYAADIVAIEEFHEFAGRKNKGENLPIITSCCPAWVNYCERFFPDFIKNLSTCRSPQQALGAIIKSEAKNNQKITKKIVVVSIMPCSAKKYEAKRPEHLNTENVPDVDIVIGANELARIIREAGIDLKKIEPSAMDMPYGFKTGAGIIFGASGGVAEAVMRLATGEMTLEDQEYEDLGFAKKYIVGKNGNTLRIAVTSGLANSAKLLNHIKNSGENIDIVEIMACPGGCINGAAQPVATLREIVSHRKEGIKNVDRSMELRRSADNPFLPHLDHQQAHELLHTSYSSKKRIEDDGIGIISANREKRSAEISVCIGTSCFLRGSQQIISALANFAEKSEYKDRISVTASFCHEFCDKGPTVVINGVKYEKCAPEKAIKLVKTTLEEYNNGQ